MESGHQCCKKAACTKYYMDRKWSSLELSWLWHHPWLCSFKIINEKFLQFYLICKVKQQQRLPLQLRARVPSWYSHFIHATPKYTVFPFKRYTVIHIELSHKNYYVYNTLLTEWSCVNEHLGQGQRNDSRETCPSHTDATTKRNTACMRHHESMHS